MNNLKIDSIGTFSGGVYDSVDIDGLATINGNLSAQTIDNDGLLTINGSIDCQDFDCDGTATVNGDARAEHMDLDGLVTFSGNVHCNHFECDGTATIKGNFKCDDFTSSGLVTISGYKFEGTKITGDGYISAKQAQVSADVISFEGRISANEIVGESVTIRSHNPHGLFVVFGLQSKINLIEATTVDLKGVKAATVNGHNIRLNQNCEIDSVDCTGTLHIHPTCRIGSITGNYQMV